MPLTLPKFCLFPSLLVLFALCAPFADPSSAQLPVFDSAPSPSEAVPELARVKSIKAKKVSGGGLDVRLAVPPGVQWTSTVRPDGVLLLALDNAVGKRKFRPLAPSGGLVTSVASQDIETGTGSVFQIQITPATGIVDLHHSVTRDPKGLLVSLERPASLETPDSEMVVRSSTEAPPLSAPSSSVPGATSSPAAPATTAAPAVSTVDKPGVTQTPIEEDPVPTVTFPYSPPVEAYRIDSGDTLSLDVFGISELKREVEVGPDGRIALPILGRLSVSDQTLEEAEQTIARVLKERGLATTPEVFLTVSKYESQGVFVQGAVGQPGIVQIPGGKRVMELLSEVGGLSQRDPAGQRIFILRTNEQGNSEKMVIDAARLLAQGDFSLNVMVLPGDLVMVPEPSRVQVFVSGAVQNPGPVDIANGTGLTVLQAITAAGGPTPRAKLQNVSIIRRHADGSQETIPVNIKKIRNGSTLDVPLQNGDSVVVKEWFF